MIHKLAYIKLSIYSTINLTLEDSEHLLWIIGKKYYMYIYNKE